MFNAQALTEKWSPVLGHEGAGAIKDNYRKAVTAVLLENTERQLREERGMINEASNTVGAIGPAGLSGDSLANTPQTGGLAGFDPVMISLIRRAMPNLVAYDICGVQPMSGPTGLIFAMKSHYQAVDDTGLRTGREALYNEPDVNFSASSAGAGVYDNNPLGTDDVNPLGDGGTTDANPGLLNDGGTYEGGASATAATGITRDKAETLGSGAGNLFNEMDFSIEKTAVTAKTRALRAEYTLELAQDLKAIHGLDAEQELANLLSSEILAEINREVVRTVYTVAKQGAQNNVANGGVFDLDVDSNGRWSVEKFKGLMFQLEREANQIAKATRRGKGNLIICSSDVASALSMAGLLDHTPALSDNLNVDDTGNTFAGVLNGRFKVFIDPYFDSSFASGAAGFGGTEYFTVGYKGSSAYDAGLFYCPYVPLQMVRAVGENSFQPKIAFKTRYGMVANPFATTNGAGAIDLNGSSAVAAGNRNVYYRSVLVRNLM